MKLRALLMVFISGLLFMFVLPSAAKEKVTISLSGNTALKSASKNRVASVTIRTLKVETDRGGTSVSHAQSGKLVTVIKQLDITINGQQIFVPRSVFADLIEPRYASLRLEHDVFMLSIEGADGVNSYIVYVYFDGNNIIRRVVYSALVPDKPVEETHYWLRVLKDE
jgi:competence protein ComGC